ncbi:hypothetical protein ACVW0I_000483 [Bradyrhizobium sp. LM6.11]
MQGLADMHGRARRRLVRQQHRDAIAQRLRRKGRRQRRQHRKAIFLADLLHGPDDDRLAGADGQNLAVECLAHQRLQKHAGLDAVGSDAEQDQVGQFARQYSSQLVGAGAFGGDEAEILQHFGEKSAQMALAVGHACARRHLSSSEGFRPSSSEFNSFIFHRKPLPFRDRCVSDVSSFKYGRLQSIVELSG